MKKIVFTATIILILGFIYFGVERNEPKIQFPELTSNMEEEFGLSEDLDPLTIEVLRKEEYPGSDLVIEETLTPGTNYSRYIASYESCNASLSSKDDKSNCLKINGLLTIPFGEAPEGGLPAIIFNHGYIPPAEYRTTERYVAYVDGFARNGYVVFKSDYRGHGNSEGQASGAYGSNSYMIDVLNALASVKKYPGVNPNAIGMWGHSLGGFLTLRSMVTSKDIKAAVIWAGVVGSYQDLLNNWRRGNFTPPPGIPLGARRWRQVLTEKYGTPEQNPSFWNSISANTYLSDISGPIQLHHGTADTSVPVEFSKKLEEQMREVGKEVELYIYNGDDHNLSNNFGAAMQRSVDFFDKYLKN